MTDIDTNAGSLASDYHVADAWTAALADLQAAITEVQRLGAVLNDAVVGSLLGPFVAASAADTDSQRRAALDKMAVANDGIAERAMQYAHDCNAAIRGPLAAAYAALQEQQMTTHNVTIDFDHDFGMEAPRIMVNDVAGGDTVVATFVTPKDDPKFTLGVVHQAAGQGTVYIGTLRDASGKTIRAGESTQLSLRMASKTPPARGQNLILFGGATYTLMVEAKDKSLPRVDFYFAVNT